jgi:hypothetical protein
VKCAGTKFVSKATCKILNADRGFAVLGKASDLDHSPTGDAITSPYIVICMNLSVVTVTVLVLGIIRIEESTVST